MRSFASENVNDSNVCKTIVITEKMRTWKSEIAEFVRFCSRIRRQHVVVFSFTEDTQELGKWSSVKIETYSKTKANICSEKQEDFVEIFLPLADVVSVRRPRFSRVKRKLTKAWNPLNDSLSLIKPKKALESCILPFARIRVHLRRHTDGLQLIADTISSNFE